MSRRVALVTGGGAGIGAAIAARLAAEGADVVVADLDPDRASARAEALRGRALTLDVADHESVLSHVRGLGRVDILVNNAGVDHFGWFQEVPYETWKRVLAVNLDGVLNCTQAVLPTMQEAGWGRIVTVGSEAGRIGSKGNAAYAAAKGAVDAFTKSIARENARFAITANVVSPGPIDTPLLREMSEHAIDVVTRQTQLRRLGTPEEVASAVAFLASDEASFITGENLGVSGGMHLGG